MSVTINDMERMATSLPELNFQSDMSSNIIEVSDLGDDFGMSLLANKKYSTPSNQNPVVSQQQGTRFDIQSLNMGMSGGMQEVDINKSEPLQSFDFSMETELPTISISKDTSSSFQPSNTFGPGSSFANQQSSTAPSVSLAPAVPRDLVKEAAEKSELINKLQRLEAKGFPCC